MINWPDKSRLLKYRLVRGILYLQVPVTNDSHDIEESVGHPWPRDTIELVKTT